MRFGKEINRESIMRKRIALYKLKFPRIFKVRRRKVRSKKPSAKYLKFKDAAQQLAEEKIEKFNKIYNFKLGKISIKNQKTRWGSCSSKGNINFNYKIALLPERICDYIVVHELCHLGEFNHSRKFWNLVAVAVPDYADIRAQLKRSDLRFY